MKRFTKDFKSGIIDHQQRYNNPDLTRPRTWLARVIIPKVYDLRLTPDNHLYVMGNYEYDFFKVGISKQPFIRLNQLKSNYSYISHLIPHGAVVEKDFHDFIQFVCDAEKVKGLGQETFWHNKKTKELLREMDCRSMRLFNNGEY